MYDILKSLHEIVSKCSKFKTSINFLIITINGFVYIVFIFQFIILKVSETFRLNNNIYESFKFKLK